MTGLHIYGDLNNFAYPILQGAHFDTNKCIVKYTKLQYNNDRTGRLQQLLRFLRKDS